jgi:hypothetical protein
MDCFCPDAFSFDMESSEEMRGFIYLFELLDVASLNNSAKVKSRELSKQNQDMTRDALVKSRF